MSTLTEKLQFLLTADASSAIKGFKSVETAADKALAKTETGASKGMATFKKYGAVAGGAGLVIGAAALKAAGAFEHLALAAGKLSHSTGLTTEAASRWIEVAGDMGIEVATVETAVSKMDKALGTSPAKFEALGVAIAHTASGAVDVNATFLNAIDVVNGIQDPMQRAKVAAELFGKGWTSMSELIRTGSGVLKKSLDSVDSAKVITSDKLAKAEDYRAAMDNLHDAMQNVGLVVGEALVPALEGTAALLTDIAGLAGPAAAGVAGLAKGLSGDPKASGWWRAVTGALTLGGTELRRWYDTQKANSGPGGGGNYFLDNMYNMPAATGDAAKGIAGVTDETSKLAIVTKAQGAAAVQAAQNADTLGVAFGTAAQAATGLATNTDAVTTALGKAETAWKSLTGSLDSQDAQRAIEESDARLAEMTKAATTGYVDTGKKNKKGKKIYKTVKRAPTAAEQRAIDAEASSNIRQRLAQAEKASQAELDAYGDQVKSQRNKTATASATATTLRVRIQPYVDAGDEAEVRKRLDAIAKLRIIPFEPQLRTGGLGPLSVDGGISDTAVAEAIARARKKGLLSS